jgi:hypothetical protein
VFVLHDRRGSTWKRLYFGNRGRMVDR